MAEQFVASQAPDSYENLTYPKPNITDNTLDENISEQALPLDNGRHILDPKTDLGQLGRLPLEILDEILALVDLKSLTAFRRVNQRAMQSVDCVPQYKTIIKHATATLRGILAIGCRVSCRELLYALNTPLCKECQDFGGFIYLPSCTRICYLCFTKNKKYLPLLATEVKRKYGLDSSMIKNLPAMQSIPGSFSPCEKKCRTRFMLYDSELAREVAEKAHGSASAMAEYVQKASRKSSEAYQKRLSNWTSKQDGPKPRRPPEVVAYDGKESNVRRFLTIVRAPWLNPTTKLGDWGFHCTGCEKQCMYYGGPLHWRRKFSHLTFDSHLKECGMIKDGLHVKPPASNHN